MAKTQKTSSDTFDFASCAVGSRDRIWFAAEDDGDAKLLQLRQDKWLVKTPDWDIATICGTVKGERFEVLAVGTHGELLIGIAGGFSESHIDPKGRGPDRLGVIRDARFLGKDVYVVGMSRQAYRRSGNTWTDIGTPIHAKPTQSRGFNSVTGDGKATVFAAGFGGEIWTYDGAAWTQLDSPTNVALQKILYTKEGVIYACGQAGALLRGDGDGFEPVRQTETTDNLYGLAWFDDRLFVASLTKIWTLEGDRLEPVDVGIPGRLTTGDLEAGAGMLWSVGAKHLLRTENGKTWKLVICDL